ncbi:MAG: glutathione transferase GstA [Steroidobacteraceae bacterium]|jgi:glutathione S-transferase
MQLYYAPGACSLASHIALQESGLPYQAVRVNLRDKLTSDGVDFNSINPKGYVPALKLDNGEVLTEGPALLAYIGELQPTRKLIAAPGTIENYRVREWLVYIGTELHKNASPLFNPKTPEAARTIALEAFKRRLSYVNDALANRPYLAGENFSVADAYLFTILTWLPHLGVELTQWPKLQGFYERVKARPAVQTALKAEASSH